MASAPAVAKKASAPKKSKPSPHPTYFEMVKEALVALKERTGSSHYAIAKHIEEQQKVTLPSTFRKILSVQLKNLVASGKLVKVKNSFKLAPIATKSEEPKLKPKAATVKKTKAAPKKTAPAKAKAKVAAKPKAAAKPVKKVKPAKAAAKSPAKKVAATKVKKAVEKARKPKSIRSPAKKAPAAKRAKK